MSVYQLSAIKEQLIEKVRGEKDEALLKELLLLFQLTGAEEPAEPYLAAAPGTGEQQIGTDSAQLQNNPEDNGVPQDKNMTQEMLDKNISEGLK